jgi:hypothetical protein
MLDEQGWRELCQRLARENDVKRRRALLRELEMAVREEQLLLKTRLRPRVDAYLEYADLLRLRNRLTPP